MAQTEAPAGEELPKLGSIPEAIEAMAQGRMVILVDDEDRENEGDLVVAASKVTPEHINFMCREGRGLICLAMVGEQVDKLGLAAMTDHNNAPLETAFTVSIDHRDAQGISASARAATILAAVDENASAEHFVSPGHVMPLRARAGGVLVRTGQTEGSVDLARLAGLEPAGVICEVMNRDGSMARLPTLIEFGKEHDMPVVTVADLIRYRLQHEPLVRCMSRAVLPTEHGDFDVHCYENTANGDVHVALVQGDISGEEPTLVRVHRAQAMSDVFAIDQGPARSRLHWALKRMATEGAGVLLYLRSNDAVERLDEQVAQVAGDIGAAQSAPGSGFHDFGVGAQILRDLGLRDIRVITNKPQVFKGLSGYDLEIVDWVPFTGEPTSE